MSNRKALETLHSWFGNEQFRVNKMTDMQVVELANTLGIYRNLRTSVGYWLSQNDGLEYGLRTERNRIKLVVLEPATDSKPGVYQIQSDLVK